MNTFEFAAGSVVGRSHALTGKANQDAFALRTGSNGICGVVCDGCGSGKRSEVGAAMGARIIVEQAVVEMDAGSAIDDEATWERIRSRTLEALGHVLQAMGEPRARIVTEYFLFTIVGIAISTERAVIFGIGDGIFAVGDDIVRIGPFEGNAPPYLGYGLLGEGPRFSLHRAFGVNELQSALVGTDGAADYESLSTVGRREVPPLKAFWQEDRYFRNEDALRRALWLCNREVTKPLWNERRIVKEPGLLEDDTTILVVRRKA